MRRGGGEMEWRRREGGGGGRDGRRWEVGEAVTRKVTVRFQMEMEAGGRIVFVGRVEGLVEGSGGKE